MFDAIREFAYGLRSGAHYTLTNRHDMVEKAVSPSLAAARKNGKVNTEGFGH